MSQTIDYKSTIRLPQTDFPMKGNLPQQEPGRLQFWKDQKIYERVLAKNQGQTKFVLPDGPPYANGSIHLGHALNKTLKDIVIKYKNLRGYSAEFIPGWDCHGLPIEHKVMKDLAEKKVIKSDDEILNLCRAEAQHWVNHQREQFKRLGVLADWDHPYLTMSPEYEAEEVREFARAFEKGLIYRGEKPVYWNWTLKTALADAEVEYHMHKSPSIYVKFPITDTSTLQKLNLSNQTPTSFLIWTTTPWTLPANLGVALHPDFDYGVYRTGSENLVLAQGLKDFVEKETGLSLELLHTLKGQTLERGEARHPWLNRASTIVLGLHVTLDAGTGVVHTAPGHGADDFKVGQKYGLGVLNPVDDGGAFTDEVPEFKGLNIFKANPLIIEKLKTENRLVALKDITHSYPHCWRTKTPLIFRTTPQWFLGIDLEKSQLREKILSALKSVQFIPEWGEARFKAMIENRPDWCLSRQRIWGVPIPILYCKATGEPLADLQVMARAAEIIEKGGVEAYWKTSADEIAGSGHIKGSFGSQGFRHGRDILDVWFDSGVCHAAVQKKRGLGFPADIYLEGSDQHRGWFNTSMLSSMATQGQPPFKTLLTHGFTVDSDGNKQSKSKGNVVDPVDVSEKMGAEIIRLWASHEDYGQDVSCGKEELTRVTETYRRLRNTVRYLLGSLGDFDFNKNAVPYEKMTKLDQWALHEFYELHEKVSTAYDKCEFYKVYHGLNVFFTVFLSATYLDILKDRLYTWKADGRPRRSSQTTLYLITEGLLKMMSPILSFLAEEGWSYFPKTNKEDSVFLAGWPVVPAQWKNPEIQTFYSSLNGVRTDVQKKLEELRAQKIIGSSLEAEVIITADGKTYDHLISCDHLREFFIVSQVRIQKGLLNVEAIKASGEKCIRCWTYSTERGLNPQHPEICPKCVEALS